METLTRNPILLTQEWLKAFKDGSNEAFKLFYEDTYRGIVHMLSSFRLPDEETKYDIAANSYAKVFKARQQFRSYDHIRGSFFLYSKNEAIDIVRLLKSKRRELPHLLYLAEHELVYDIELDDAKQVALIYMNNLTERRRTILKMFIYEGKDKFKIAEELGISPQTALNLKNVAIQDLMKAVTGKIRPRKAFQIR